MNDSKSVIASLVVIALMLVTPMIVFGEGTDAFFPDRSGSENSNGVVDTAGVYGAEGLVKWVQRAGNYRATESYEGGLSYSSYGLPVFADGIVIDGSSRNLVMANGTAYDQTTGEIIWTSPQSGIYQLKGGVYYNGVFFEQTSGGSPQLRAIDVATGQMLASLSLGGFGSSMTLSDDGFIYVGSCGGFNTGTGYAVCIDANLHKVGSTYTINEVWRSISPTGNGIYTDTCCVAGNYVIFCDTTYSLMVFDRFTGILSDLKAFPDDSYLGGVCYSPDTGKIYASFSGKIAAMDFDPYTGTIDANSRVDVSLNGYPALYNGKAYVATSYNSKPHLVCLDWNTLQVQWATEIKNGGGLICIDAEKDDGDGEIYVYITPSGGNMSPDVTCVRYDNSMSKGEVLFTLNDSTPNFVFTGVSVHNGGIYYVSDGGIMTAYVSTDAAPWTDERPVAEDGGLTVIFDSMLTIKSAKIDNSSADLKLIDALKAAAFKAEKKYGAAWDGNSLTRYGFFENTGDFKWVFGFWDASSEKWTYAETITGEELAKDYSAVGLFMAKVVDGRICVYSNSTPYNTSHYTTILFKDGVDLRWAHVCGTYGTKLDAINDATAMLGDPNAVASLTGITNLDGKSWKAAYYNASSGYAGYWSSSSSLQWNNGKMYAFYTDSLPEIQGYEAFNPVSSTFYYALGPQSFSYPFFDDGVAVSAVIEQILSIKGIGCDVAGMEFADTPSAGGSAWHVYVKEDGAWTRATDLGAMATSDILVVYEDEEGDGSGLYATSVRFLIEDTVSVDYRWVRTNSLEISSLFDEGTTVRYKSTATSLSVTQIGDLKNGDAVRWNTWQWMNGGWKEIKHYVSGSINTSYALVYGPEGTLPSYLLTSPFTKDYSVESEASVVVSEDVPAYAYYNSGVTTILVEDGVTRIGDYAFYGTGITDVVLPDSVTVIGDYAFYGCPLENVIIGNYVYSIGENAFGSMTDDYMPEFLVKIVDAGIVICRYNGNSESVAIPAVIGDLPVVEIAGMAFYDRTSLASIDIPSSVTRIGDKAFSHTGLSALSISSSDVSIGARTFESTPLSSVSFEDNVASVGAYAFYGCASLSSVTFGGTVGEMGAYAFAGTSVESFAVPSGVKAIPEGLFMNDSELVGLELGDDIVSIGDKAFYGTALSMALAIPGSVTSIGAQAFYDAPLTHLIVPSSVTSIGDQAFFCSMIESIEFAGDRESGLSVPESAFYRQSGKELVYLGWYTQEGGSGDRWDFTVGSDGITVFAFMSPPPTDPLEIFTFSTDDGRATVTGIVDGVSIAYAEVPDYVTIDGKRYVVCTIGPSAFMNKISITDVVLPLTISEIGSNAFEGCTSLTAIENLNVVKKVGTYAFRNCTSLASADLTGVIEIGGYSFNGCTALESVEFGPSLVSTGSSVFYQNSSLKSIVFSPQSSPVIQSYFAQNCPVLESVDIPDGATLYTYAFSGCSGLKYVTLGDDVTIGGTYTFRNSGVLVLRTGTGLHLNSNQAFGGMSALETVFIGGTDHIQTNAFYNCGSLKEVYIGGELPSIGTYVISNYSKCKIYYSQEYADSWSNYDPAANYNIPALPFDAVSFMMNDGTDAVCLTESVASERMFDLVSNYAPERSGYTFGGWFDDPGCTTPTTWSYERADSITASISLYAGWVPDTYSVEYVLNGGINAAANVGEYTVGTGLVLSAPSKDGCEFMGWFASPYFSGSAVSVLPDDHMGDVTLYAMWSDDEYDYNIDFVVVNGVITKYTGSAKDIAVPSVEGIVGIGANAFQNSAASSVTIPDNIISIGAGAFQNCKNLARVNIGSGVSEMGGAPFSGCIALADIAVADGNESVRFMDGILYCGTVAVQNVCSGDDAVLQDFTTSIADSAFKGTRIKTISGPDGVHIGANAFQDCSSLESILFATGSIGELSLQGCSALTSLTMSDDATFIGRNSAQRTAIESLIVGKNVERIDDYAFSNVSTLKSLTFAGNSLKTIGSNVFVSAGIESLVLPEGLETLTFGVFQSCMSLTEVVLPDSLTSMGNYMFSNCKSIEKVKLSSGLTSIGQSIFNGCSSIKEIVIPDGVQSIASQAFANCTGLESVTIPESVISIASNSFNGLTFLDSDGNVIADANTLPGYLYKGTSGQLVRAKEIAENETFVIDGMIYKVVSPEDLAVELIGYESAPTGTLTIPGTVRYNVYDFEVAVASKAFARCSEITTLNLGADAGPYAFYGCHGLKVLRIADGVATIGKSAFSGCLKISYIVMADSVESIGENAFYGCTFYDGDSAIEPAAENLAGHKFTGNRTHLSLYVPKVGGVFEVDGLKYKILSNDGIKTVSLKGFASSSMESLSVPAEVSYLGFNWNVDSISSKAFYGNATLVSVDVGNVDSIGYKAFASCPNLEAVTLDGTASLGSYAFASCPKISSLDLSTVESIGESSFSMLSGLTSVTFSDGLSSVGKNAFFRTLFYDGDSIVPRNVASLAGKTFEGEPGCLYKIA